jgi:hypothetical protein
MSTPATYSFLPWLRQGVANQITSADNDPAVTLRATLRVDLLVTGEGVGGGTVTQTVGRDVALYGPGDVVGIDRRAIVRTEPRDWTTNYEPNYLAHVEFYDEDLPWRYTPAKAAAKRLRPWIMLAVLTEDEFEAGGNVPGRPLPYFQASDLAVFPPADGLWAWAHVHVNRSLTAGDAEVASESMGAVIPKLQAALDQNPDLAYSRIVSPRRLQPDTAYHAFLVPVFETGRLAGLGMEPPATLAATFSAWAAYAGRPDPLSFPYYHRWYFRTGAAGDFESLVRLLVPRPVDPRVGRRDLDVQRPGAGLPGITDPELGGVLRLGGALRVPSEVYTPAEAAEAEMFEKWAAPYPQHPFQQALARLINLSDDYAAADAATANTAAAPVLPSAALDPDPLITPPLYGTWHALTRRLLLERDGTKVSPDENWVHELNLDPRHRVAAGFGTRIVQDRQERYMDAAWEQVGEILEANRRIRLAQLAKEAAWIWYGRHVLPLADAGPERALLLASPVRRRVLVGGLTVHHQLAASRVQPALLSGTMRRLMRPRGRLMRALAWDKGIEPGNLLDRVNQGLASAAPPRQTPDVVTIDTVADQVLGPSKDPADDPHREAGRHPGTVFRLGPCADFALQDPFSERRTHPGDRDSEEGERLKEALEDSYALEAASQEVGTVPPKAEIDLGGIIGGILDGIDPEVTIPRRTRGGMEIPERIRPEEFIEAMAYPVIDEPMYKPLVDTSTELFLPNLNLIAPDSITLLETNQKFIEAYMVGLNHEFARELLWREYPTDQRGSYFRQFWDVRDYLASSAEDPDELRERLRDIPRLHRWSRYTMLGDHDQREAAGEKEEEVVLVIRGELLKRYPTAVIYAHRAKWQLKTDGSGQIDPAKERELVALTAAEESNPPRSKLRTPLYEAKVEPDVYFFGFDLTAEAAKGGSGADPSDDPGWFFVIKERPGETRFGLDIDGQPDLNVWNDLSWADVQLDASGAHLLAPSSAKTLVQPSAAGDEQEKIEQWNEDTSVPFGPAMTSADMAYVLFQAPVLVAIHAAEMLRPR